MPHESRTISPPRRAASRSGSPAGLPYPTRWWSRRPAAPASTGSASTFSTAPGISAPPSAASSSPTLSGSRCSSACPTTSSRLIPRVLDHGAAGIVLAMASEPEVVAAAIERARYQPEGRRSFGGQRYGMRRGAERSRRGAPGDLRHARDPPRHRGDQGDRRRSRALPASMSGRPTSALASASAPIRRHRPTARRSQRSSPPATRNGLPVTMHAVAARPRRPLGGPRLRRAGADGGHRSCSAAPSPTFSAARVPASRARRLQRSRPPAARYGQTG